MFDSLIREFGKLAFDRGYKFYKQDRITSFKFENDRITATVREGGDKNYSVNIVLDSMNNIQSYDCTCPFWHGCKHVIATMAFFLESERGAVDIKGPMIITTEKEKNDKIIVLNTDEEPSVEIYHLLNNLAGHARFDSKKNDGRIWRQVFKLRVVEELDDNRFELSLGMQFKKKNESYGSIYNYVNRQVFEESDSLSAELVSAILRKREKKDDFINFFGFFKKLENPLLYFIYDYKQIPVKLQLFTKIKIEFHFEDVFFDKYYFRPYVSFLSDNTSFSHSHKIRSWIYSCEDIILILFEDGSLFYKENDPELSYFIHQLFKQRQPFTYSDIIQLIGYVKDHLNKVVDIIPPPQKIRITYPYPILFMELSRGAYDFVQIITNFYYSGKEINQAEKEEYLYYDRQDSIQTVIRRNRKQEKKIISYLHNIFEKYIAPESYSGTSSDTLILQMTIPDFLIRFGDQLLDKGFMVRMGKEKNINRGFGKISIGLSKGINWFDVDLKYIDENGESHVLEITKDLEKGILNYKNQYILLKRGDLEKIKRLCQECDKNDQKLRLSRFNLPALEDLAQDLEVDPQIDLNQLISVFRKLKDHQSIEEYPLPENFKGQLRGYQVAGYRWLHFLHQSQFGGCLADEMGLGKTVQTLAFLQKLKEENKLDLVLIVVPVTTMANWEKEIAKYTPDFSVLRHAGTNRIKDQDYFKGFDLILVSYSTLRNDFEIFEKFEFSCMVLDESQMIKNSFTKTFRAVRRIRAKQRITLTGTPVENNTLELWTQMEFLNPGMLGTIRHFRHEYAQPIEEDENKDIAEKLRRKIYPFVLRRTKNDVLKDLPDKEILVTYCEMSHLHEQAYLDVKAYYKNRIQEAFKDKGMEKSHTEIFEALLRLRQMAILPKVVDEKYANIESSKLELLKDLLDEIIQEKHKVLIFSQFVTVLKEISLYLGERNIRYSYLDGSTRWRHKEIESFQENSEIPVFLLSLKAGGLGINLTSADYVILFDPWWNPATEKQAIDRSHRIGQTKKVTVYKIITENTIEEKVLLLQERKNELVGKLISEDSRMFKQLNEEDILNLFD
ncbi:MAG: DEAD/DEAH box helicase family protein [Spirochaetales bacterium]|nr:DEAD/DEAH box helicase family protein [Spirochaetales bacterium]